MGRGAPRLVRGRLLLLVLLAWPAWALEPTHLVQHICADPAVLPFEAACIAPRPAEAGPLPWRRFDRFREQASDSVLWRRRGATLVAQTFDFPPFGTHQPAHDGGDLIGPRGDGVGVWMTQDGASGVLWFQSPECADGREAGLGGWLLWAGQPALEWRERLVFLHATRAAARCPFRHVPSLTRWRLMEVDYPWWESEAERPAFRAQTVVSEHYDGRDVLRARHMERFWFARHLGKLRWENWENPALSRRVADAAQLARAVERCPAVAGSVAPAPGWVMADCRMWTRFERGVQAMPGWPAAE